MPSQVYEYRCEHCLNLHEARVDVERRDEPQVCPYCGNGARRVFLPADILCSWTFNACMISDVEPSRDQIVAQERRNEEGERIRPKEKPSFEQCVKSELEKGGIRHPHRLIEP